MVLLVNLLHIITKCTFIGSVISVLKNGGQITIVAYDAIMLWFPSITGLITAGWTALTVCVIACMLLSKKPCIELLYELDGVCSLGNPEVPLRNTGVFSSLYILWNSILTIDSTCDAKSRSSFLARHNQYKCDLLEHSRISAVLANDPHQDLCYGSKRFIISLWFKIAASTQYIFSKLERILQSSFSDSFCFISKSQCFLHSL